MPLARWPALQFDCHLDAMRIDAQWLDQPWPRGNATAAAVALDEVGHAADAPALPVALYDYLLQQIRCVPTLKRHLARRGTHFQA